MKPKPFIGWTALSVLVLTEIDLEPANLSQADIKRIELAMLHAAFGA